MRASESRVVYLAYPPTPVGVEWRSNRCRLLNYCCRYAVIVRLYNPASVGNHQMERSPHGWIVKADVVETAAVSSIVGNDQISTTPLHIHFDVVYVCCTAEENR